MNKLLALLALIIAISFFQSCEDSLGLERNVIKTYLSKDYDHIDFIPKIGINDWVIIDNFYSDENGNRTSGGYLWSDTLKTLRKEQKNGKECVVFGQISVVPGSVSRFEYTFVIEGNKLYRDAVVANMKAKSQWDDIYGAKWPFIIDSCWFLAIDFSKDSWIHPDTLYYTNHIMKYDVYFTGYRSFRGEKGGIRLLYLDGKVVPCLEIFEYFKLCGEVTTAGNSKKIDYEWRLKSYYGIDGTNFLLLIYENPEYDFGYGYVPEFYLTSEVVQTSLW